MFQVQTRRAFTGLCLMVFFVGCGGQVSVDAPPANEEQYAPAPLPSALSGTGAVGQEPKTMTFEVHSGSGRNSNRGHQPPVPSFTSKVSSAAPLFHLTTFDMANGKRYGLTTGNKYIITNRNNEGNLKNVNVTLAFYSEDGTRNELKRYWAVWKKSEGKEIDVWKMNLGNVQRIDMQGNAELESSIQGKGKVSVSWLVQ